jgi:von Willebrand factor type D domain
MVKWSNGQMVKWSNGQMVKWSNGQMVKWSNYSTNNYLKPGTSPPTFAKQWSLIYFLIFGILLFTFPISSPAEETTVCNAGECNYTVQFDRPGFYIAVVTLPPNQREGVWSLIIDPPTTHLGSFHGGGVLKESGTVPSWVAFSLAQAGVVYIDPFNYPHDPVPFRLELMKEQDNKQYQSVWGPTLVNPGQRYTTTSLEPGFYVAVANSTGQKDFFGLSLWNSTLFGGVSGGWLDSQTGVGFAAFDITQPRTVNFKLWFGQIYGDLGVERLNLEIYYQKADGTRELYWSTSSLPPQGSNAILITADAKQTSSNSKIAGNISVAGGDFVTSAVATHFQKSTVKVNIEVDPAHIDKKADLLLVVGMAPPPAPYDGKSMTYTSISSTRSSYSLKLDLSAENWQPQSIPSFNPGVTLEKSMQVEIPQDKFDRPGMYYFFVGYRLDNGDIIYSPTPIMLEVQAGEQPYFPGIVQIVATDVDKASLAWLPATDNKTPAEAIKYEVHLSNDPNFEPTPKTLHTSVTGASQIDLVGLTAASSYNLLVVAVDTEGNRSKERDYRIARTFTKPAVVSTTTKFAEDKKLGLGSATTQDGVVFTYSAATPGVQPEVGSVLFINVEDEMYLRRVDSLESTAQGLVVHTSDGELADVLETGTIDSQITLFDVREAALRSGSRSGVRTTRSLRADGSDHYEMRWPNDTLVVEQRDYADNWQGTRTTRENDEDEKDKEGPCEIEPSSEFEPTITNTISWEREPSGLIPSPTGGEVKAVGKYTVEIEITCKFGAAGSFEPDEFRLFERKSVQFYPPIAGFIPVWQETTFSVSAKLEASATAGIEATITPQVTASIEMGARYNPTTKQWEAIPMSPTIIPLLTDKWANPDESDDGVKVGVMLEGEVRLIPKVEVRFYHVIGPEFSFEPIAKAEITYEPTPQPIILASLGYIPIHPTQFDVYLQAEAFVGLSADFISKKWSDKWGGFLKAKVWESPKWMLFSLPKLDFKGASGEVNEPITLSATTEDGENNPFDDSSIHWDVDPKEGSASGGKPGTFTASEEGTYDVFFSGHSRLPDPFGRQFALATVTVGPEKEKPKKPDGPKASTNGDPHLYTFDNLAYDFQAEGEFILAKSTLPNDSFEVQVRQKPWSKEQTGVAVTQGAVMNVAGDKVGFYLKQKPVSHINGILQELPDGSITPLPQGGKIFRKGSLYSIVWPNGGGLVEVKDNNWGFLVSTYISKAQERQMIGLLGNADGDPKNDLIMRDGTNLGTKISFDTLYPNYANSWRITQQESLFDYAPGETTETFTDRNFPRVLSKASGLSAEQRARAEQVCRDAGITDPILLEDCILDVGATGENGFAEVPSNLASPEESAYVANPSPPALGTPGFGQLKGLVYDGVTKQVINGAKVKLTVDGISLPETTVKATANGLYETDVVPTGYGYLLEIEADGYISERVFSLTIPDGQAMEVKAVNLVPTTFQGVGSISGIAKNVEDNAVIPNLTVNALRYIDAWSGEIVKTARTDQNGAFNLEGLEAGNYTLVFYLTLEEPYVTSYFTHQVTALSIGGQVTNTEVSITPYRDVDLDGAMFRIILKWNNVPYDLDSHLTGPNDENGRFHIHFANPYFNGARLDRDDRDGTGPEMVTIDYLQPGDVYRFSVHDYKSSGLTSSDTLAKSGAKVDVYSQNGLVSFNAPNQEGTLWTVFEIDESGNVVPVNTMGYEVNQGGIRSKGVRTALQSQVVTDYWPIVFQASKSKP